METETETCHECTRCIAIACGVYSVLKRDWWPEMRLLSGAVLVLLLCSQPYLANGQSSTTIPTDFFTGIKLDAVVAGPFLSYAPIYFSGSVSDPLVTEVQFSILNNDNAIIDYCSSMNWYMVPVRDRKFRHTLFFSHEQAGEYLLHMKTIRGWPPYSSAGVFGPFTVQKGPESSPIPVGFFPDIELDSPIPVEFTTGQAVQVSGTVLDPSLSMVDFSFFHRDDVFPLPYKAPIIDGKFSKTILFSHKKTGEFRLELFRYRGNEGNSTLGDIFTPVHVVRGNGAAFLPSDFFAEITLSSPMPVVYAPGQRVQVTGTVSDPSVHKVEFEFWTPIGGKPGKGKWIGFTGPVTNGEFSVNIKFPPEQDPGDGFVHVYLSRRGNRSKGTREFRPITIEPPPLPDFDGDGAVGFPDFILFARAFGTSSADQTLDPRFDLDGTARWDSRTS